MANDRGASRLLAGSLTAPRTHALTLEPASDDQINGVLDCSGSQRGLLLGMAGFSELEVRAQCGSPSLEVGEELGAVVRIDPGRDEGAD
jgi:hypothetical protein